MKRIVVTVLIFCMMASLLAGCDAPTPAASAPATDSAAETPAPATVTNNPAEEAEAPAVKCYNGTFVGTEENGVLSFKGIPFAKAPVGELRWKAPQSVEASEEIFDATSYGKAALQPEASSEPISQHPENMSEDCLTLNIWTTGDTGEKKPVMFYMHGGAFSYGSGIDTLYKGQYMVEEHPELVIVTANYRLGMMGYIDFSVVEGGEEFPTSGYNGLLDQIEALKWIRQNIEGFGGDPNNVTIFGESAGGGSVCALLAAEGTEGLFQHAIAQSGGLNFTYTHENFANFNAANLLLEKAGATCVDDLMKLSEAELFDIYRDTSDGKSLSYFSYAPLRGNGSILPEDPYQAILDGAGKDVDLMIGTTADEYNYFIFDTLNPSVEEEGHVLSEETKNAFANMMLNTSVDRLIGKCTDEEKANIKEFMELYSDEDEFWQKLELMTETGFRSPAIRFAEDHIKAGGMGKTYMYYFAKRNTRFDWIGASHGCELPYVFHNFEKEQELVSGPVIPGLADQTCGAWASFAIGANPSYNGVEWPEYSLENRETMMFNDDGTTCIENDPLSKQRELMAPLMYHYNGL